MITRLERIWTRTSIINSIPKTFFSKLEEAIEFNDSLFPNWANQVYTSTRLKQRFHAVYSKYKAIVSDRTRTKIVSAFHHCLNIEGLCDNDPHTEIIQVKDLPKSIQTEIDDLFKYLYNTALNYPGLETYLSTNVSEAIDRLKKKNGLSVCPFCGLEGFLNLKGQARLPLDHWLCRDLFPMAAVNVQNLIPIGPACNNRPAKGSKNILVNKDGERIRAYYPFAYHTGISVNFYFLNDPSINGIADEDWLCNISPVDGNEADIFRSWEDTFNISTRFKSFFRTEIFVMWEKDYKGYIDETEDLEHADSIEDFKANLRRWKSSFQLKRRPGSLLYRSFIEFLINHASEAYLYSLYMNFKDQA